MGCGRRSVQRVLMLLHQQELLVLLLERRSRRSRRSRSFRSSVHGRLHKQKDLYVTLIILTKELLLGKTSGKTVVTNQWQTSY